MPFSADGQCIVFACSQVYACAPGALLLKMPGEMPGAWAMGMGYGHEAPGAPKLPYSMIFKMQCCSQSFKVIAKHFQTLCFYFECRSNRRVCMIWSVWYREREREREKERESNACVWLLRNSLAALES